MTENLKAMTGALKMTYEAMEKPTKRRVVAVNEPLPGSDEWAQRDWNDCVVCGKKVHPPSTVHHECDLIEEA